MFKRSKTSRISILFYGLVFIAVTTASFLFFHSFKSSTLSNDNKQQNATKKKNQSRIILKDNPEIISRNSVFSIEVFVDPVEHKVSNLDLALNYDKAALKLVEIKQSQQFNQVLLKKISDEGAANYSAGTAFGKNINNETVYATLQFQALDKSGKTTVSINNQKSGIYADDNPGVNLLKDEKISTTVAIN